MIRACLNTMAISACLVVTTLTAGAPVSQEDAVKKERLKFEGTWRIVALEVDGNKSSETDARKLKVVNGPDGKWSLQSEEKEIVKGTSLIDPTQKVKTIDISPSEGDDKDKQFLGIYEIHEKTRKLCLASPGKARPTEFTSPAGSHLILVTFERETAKSP